MSGEVHSPTCPVCKDREVEILRDRNADLERSLAERMEEGVRIYNIVERAWRNVGAPNLSVSSEEDETFTSKRIYWLANDRDKYKSALVAINKLLVERGMI